MEQCRRAKGLTYEAIADELDVQRAAVWKWFHGRTVPDFERGVRLSKVLGVDPEMIAEASPERARWGAA